MKLIIRTALFFCLLFCLSGCYLFQYSSPNVDIIHSLQYDLRDDAYSWKGFDRKELFQAWGPPTRTTSDGGSGQIITYIRTIPFSFGFYTGYNHFYVNDKGTIYHVKYLFTLD